MNHESSNKSWLERLSHSLARPKNREDLLDLLQETADHHLLDPSALLMIEGVLQVYERQVRDIMVPRSQMVVLKSDATLAEILPIVISSAHSRFPVIKENKDEVIGILLAKDLLPYTFHSDEMFDLEKLVRKVTFIPESKRLNLLLEEFRHNRNHMAVVLNEYGDVSGVVTIEDLLEQIVGEIEDEYDTVEPQTDISKIGDHQFNVKSLTPIKDFNTFFNTQFSDEHFDTIGGLVTQHFGHLPKGNESVRIGNLEFKVLYSDKRKIRLLQVTLDLRPSLNPL